MLRGGSFHGVFYLIGFLQHGGGEYLAEGPWGQVTTLLAWCFATRLSRNLDPGWGGQKGELVILIFFVFAVSCLGRWLFFCRSEALARLICCLLGSFVVFCVLCASLFLTNIPTPPHSSSAGLFPLAFLPCLKLSWDVFSYACTAIATNMVLAAGLAMHFSPWLGGFGGRERHGASLGWDRRVVECVLYMFLTSTNPFWVVRNDNKK